MNFTNRTFYNKYLKGNEMTDFIEKFIDYDDIDFIPKYEDVFWQRNDDETAKVYEWYKVRDMGDNDLIITAIKKCRTLAYFTCKGCLFIGFTWTIDKKEIKDDYHFEQFVKAIVAKKK